MSNSPPTLLTVAAGVENMILLFVSSGDGGIQDFLNFRLVCSTTKLWVDRLPKKQQEFVLSKATIRLKLNAKTVRQFVTSPPPFKMTSLIVIADDGMSKYLRNDTWTRFCNYWSSNLQTLELEPRDSDSSPYNPRVLDLMRLPNLLSISIWGDDLVLPKRSDISSCFENITNLEVCSILPGDPRQSEFYSQMQRNRNLREWSIHIHAVEDLVEVSNFIDLRKDDPQLRLTFEMLKPLFETALRQGERNYHSVRQAFRNFANSILASNSIIRLEVVCSLENFDKLMNELFPRAVCLELFSMVESVDFWTPTNEPLSLLIHFPRLKRLSYVNTLKTSPEYYINCFPSWLEELGFTIGFVPFGCFPPNLTILHLDMCKFVRGNLQRSLNWIRSGCPHLTELKIFSWKADSGEITAPVADFVESSSFSNLKLLYFSDGNFNEDDVEEFRTALANGFDWPNLKLTNLFLNFEKFNSFEIPLMIGEEILSGLLNGPSVKSLRSFTVTNGCVTAEALPLLKKLESLPYVNSWWLSNDKNE